MQVISLRIGWITPTDHPEGSNLAEPEVAIWQSHEDFGQLVEKYLEAQNILFDIFYGISDNPFHFFKGSQCLCGNRLHWPLMKGTQLR